MTKSTRRSYLAVMGAVGLAGCLGQTGGSSQDDSSDSNASESFGDSSEGPPTEPRNLPLPADVEDIEEATTRGAGKDSIPSIDQPQFMSASSGDEFLEPIHPVFGIVHNGEAKAYPQRVLVWHEIVNDVIDGTPIAVTYCPLTGTAQGFERGETSFGVSGLLANSNLIMYDRGTDTYWPQMLATGIKGPHIGDELREFNVTWTTWERWRSTYPDTQLLTDETAFARDYNRDPYGAYNPPSGHYANENLMFPQFQSSSEYDFQKKRVVIGVRSEDGVFAIPKDVIADSLVRETEVGGVPYIVVYDQSLHTVWVYRNPAEKSVEPDGAQVILDGETYEPDELPLESIVRYDAFWFAWEGYYPETEVID